MKSTFAMFSLIAVSMVACSKEEAPSSASSGTSVPAAASAAVPTEGATPAQPKAEGAASGPVTFKWSDAPKAADIPEEALNGDSNGKRWEAKSVVIEPGFKEGWEVKFYESEIKEPLGFGSGQFIELDFKDEPKAGVKITKPMKYGDGFFQINSAEGGGLTSWNAENAYYLEFSEWDVKPYDEQGSSSQVAGKASGKVYVAYKGTGSFKNSGLWGTFKDAVVRYSGKPHWLKK
ncbi:MAG: hypothetical protein AB7K71_03765 [Polyangiaceae bacterium]